MCIKEMVKDGKSVTFIYYKDSELWYRTECGFDFPVPIDDTGNATFLPKDRAMFFMRYIRKHLDMLTATREQVENAVNRMVLSQ